MIIQNKMTRQILVVACAILLVSFTDQKSDPVQKFDLKQSIERGKEIYSMHCITCHMDGGEGLEGVFPPLAKSDYLMADKKRSIQQVLYGARGEMMVNGKLYNGEMAPLELSDVEASDVLNFIRNSWGNKGEAVRPDDVRAARTN
jgi:mono/diheme cytochrome c family protein